MVRQIGTTFGFIIRVDAQYDTIYLAPECLYYASLSAVGADSYLEPVRRCGFPVTIARRTRCWPPAYRGRGLNHTRAVSDGLSRRTAWRFWQYLVILRRRLPVIALAVVVAVGAGYLAVRKGKTTYTPGKARRTGIR